MALFSEPAFQDQIIAFICRDRNFLKACGHMLETKGLCKGSHRSGGCQRGAFEWKLWAPIEKKWIAKDTLSKFEGEYEPWPRIGDWER